MESSKKIDQVEGAADPRTIAQTLLSEYERLRALAMPEALQTEEWRRGLEKIYDPHGLGPQKVELPQILLREGVLYIHPRDAGTPDPGTRIGGYDLALSTESDGSKTYLVCKYWVGNVQAIFRVTEDGRLLETGYDQPLSQVDYASQAYAHPTPNGTYKELTDTLPPHHSLLQKVGALHKISNPTGQ